MCGIRIDGKRGRFQCAVNADQRIADTARIVATLDGRRVYPLTEREHREPVVHSLAGTGCSKNSSRVILRKPRSYQPRIVVPAPVPVDLARSADDPVRWWATPP
jgi:hypothetical protein